MNPDLSIIIVNWNSAGYLRKCLESIVNTTSGILYEIIVVDNASYDGCERVVNEYPGIAFLVQSESNRGFARANNLGLRHARGRVLLFLNPDTEVLGDSLTKLYHAIFSLENPGGLGCRVLNTDGTLQTRCVQAFPTIVNQLLDANFIRNLIPKSRLWGMSSLFGGDETGCEVEAIAGSCLMVRREPFERVGLFSEEYFMYAEDLDLCYKMRQGGYRNYHLGGASIIHHGGGSTKTTGESAFSAVLMRESVRKFLRKFHGITYSHLYVFSTQVSSVMRIVLILLLFPVSAFKKLKQKNLRNSLNKWQGIFLWSIGRQVWVKRP